MNAARSLLSSPRVSKALFWFGVAVLAAGLALLIVKLADRGSSSQTSAPAKQANSRPVIPPKPAKQTVQSYSQLDSGAKRTIREFILYGVTTKDLGRVWRYVAPSLRSGYTYKSWKHANAVPFQVFPVWHFKQESHFHLASATRKRVYVDVSLTPKPKLQMRVTVFTIGLTKAGKGTHGRWLVSSWWPRWTPPIPEAQ